MSGEQFDGLLMNMAQQQRGIEPLLDTIFSFLRRKTDFFKGASSAEQYESVVLQALRKQAAIAEKDSKAKKVAGEKKAKKAKKVAKEADEVKASIKQAKEATSKVAADSVVEKKKVEKEVVEDDVMEMDGDGGFDLSDTKSSSVATSSSTDGESSAGNKVEDKDKEDDDKEEEDNEPAPIGNGGTNDYCVWTQTLQELELKVPKPDVKSKLLNISFTSTKITIGVKGQPPIREGKLFKRIKVDDSYWTIEDGTIHIYLQKENQMEWWKCPVVGDAEINTQKVCPENSKLGDLDGDTRQTVEKMMFDQRQKAMGLPTSDEQKKSDMLAKFMAQHPEMDFSKAKIN